MKTRIGAAAMMAMLIANSALGLDSEAAEKTPKWQVSIDGMPDLTGDLVVVTKGGWNTIYRLSEGPLSVTVRVNNRAKQHIVSIKDESAELDCTGMVTVEPQEASKTVLLEGSVACGKSFRADSPDLLSLTGSFITKK